VLTTTVLAVYLHPLWVYAAMFIGCGLAMLLAKMPWNVTRSTAVRATNPVNENCGPQSRLRRNSNVEFEQLANPHKDAVYRQLMGHVATAEMRRCLDRGLAESLSEAGSAAG
jgi:hypothetical protein